MGVLLGAAADVGIGAGCAMGVADVPLDARLGVGVAVVVCTGIALGGMEVGTATGAG
jgi:hypothetical protein